MRSIDIHAHISPAAFISAMEDGEDGEDWHGITSDAVVAHRHNPRTVWTPEQRLADMDSLGIQVQVLSTNAVLYNYDKDASATAAMARDCNDYVSQLTKDHPDRFAGLCTLPMQDVSASIDELERGMTQLGLKGAMIGDHVNGRTFDEPEFLPLWKAAEQLGALILIHQGGPTVVSSRTTRYHLPNTLGNLADRVVTFASFVYGGVMDACPDLKVCLSHAGGYTCFGIGRMDRGWQVRSEARVNITQPPSAYLSRFYYDTITHSESALRYIIDSVGVERVLFGTDWPYDMCTDWPASWILGLETLTQDEKEMILWRNLEALLGI
jgi:aminocarboxymuconate-semialdehyde decarboxylase